MESLSSVGTIVRIAQDIAGAVATVSKNRSRCRKLAERVQAIGDLLRELNDAEAGTATAGDDATSKLLGRLEEALQRALRLVRSCQDQFRVTVTSDAAVDIPSLLGKVKEKLNRNVELITPGTTKNANSKSLPAGASNDMDRQNYRRCAIGDETKKEKPAAIAAAAAASMAAGSNQAPPPFAYLPFAVALIPIGDAATASSMYLAPSPYPQGPPAAGYAVQAQRPSNPQHVHFNSTEKCDGTGDANHAVKNSGDRDEKKGNVTDDVGGADKEVDPVLTAGDGKRKDGGKTAAAAAGNATAAIGVPVHTVTAGVAGLVQAVPPPSYGHGYLPYARGRGRDAGHCCCQNNAGGLSDDAAAAANNYNNHYSWYPDMFSDENPNACSVM